MTETFSSVLSKTAISRPPDSRNQLNSADRRAWEAFENVCSNFLGNKKSENHVEILE
jgi:hypothetical protein